MVLGAVITVLVGLVVGVVACYLLLRSHVEAWASSTLADWRSAEEQAIRSEAGRRSEAVLRGRVTEQLAPLLYDFPFSPTDARFIGTPIDFVVFDGYADVKSGARSSLRSIVFVDIKTGAAKLTPIQRRIKECVESKNVWNHALRAAGDAE
jgi:predicted Holliday junction resolvase-like endonuclease